MALNKFEKYEIVEIQRSDIRNAPYNPRKINDDAKRKLKKNIQEVGLLTPIVWNETTGNIVSGHQRISQLDTLCKGKDYSLRVAKVVLDEKTEKEQNIFMNNSHAQGEFDLDKLEDLFKTGIDIENTGFNMGEIYQNFGDNPLYDRPEDLKKLSEKLETFHETMANIKAKTNDRDDADFYLVAIFRSSEERKKITDYLGLEDNRYMDGKILMEKLNVA